MNRITNTKLIALALFFSSCVKRSFEKEKLDSYFNYLESVEKFMGSVIISKEGKTIYSISTGFSNIENNTAIFSGSEYLIGSLSNTFTAVLIFKAAEAGLIDFNQTIHSFFTNLPNAKKITISDLLYHRSGLNDLFDTTDFFLWNTTPLSKEEIIDKIITAGTDCLPGKRQKYSNSNYILLTFILEDVFNQSYSKLLKEYIKKPCEMNGTYYYGKNDLKKNFCTSYSYAGYWKPVPPTNPSIPYGACGIVSTPWDLIKFSKALFDSELISPESMERMMTIKGHFGMGLMPIEFEDQIGFGHTGTIDGFSSMMFHFFNDNVSITFCSNAINYNINDIIRTLLLAAYNKPFDIPNMNLISLTPQELERYKGSYYSKNLNVEINITSNGTTLLCHSGQKQPIVMDILADTIFECPKNDFFISINLKDSTLRITQKNNISVFKSRKQEN